MDTDHLRWPNLTTFFRTHNIQPCVQLEIHNIFFSEVISTVRQTDSQLIRYFEGVGIPRNLSFELLLACNDDYFDDIYSDVDHGMPPNW